MPTARVVEKALRALGTREKALSSSRFFKTGKGEYGEGDVFIGVTVPEQRRVAKTYQALPLAEIEVLLQSPIHECRLTALLILVAQFEKGDVRTRARIARFYLAHTKHINNWDLVDASAHYILGTHMLESERGVLIKLARSKNLWEQRIAVVATFALIRVGQFEDFFAVSALLRSHKHDLIHKAIGWMFREVGKHTKSALISYLEIHAPALPRTTLRYAIERLSAKEKTRFMKRV